MSDAAKNIIDLYRRHADEWVVRRSQTLFEKPWLDRFLSHLPKAPSVLDIGCGSGAPIGTYLATACGTYTGVDTSPELLAIAQARNADATWINADMRALDLTQKFHGILAWNSSFHLTQDDQRAMFPIFGNHAAAGAVLMFTSGTSHGARMGEFAGAPLYHASLAPEEYRVLLDANGFEVVAHVAEDPACQGHTVWLARLRD
jgi:SAM-dependent methyltransferase